MTEQDKNPAVVTLWFVTAAEPASILEAEPKADRGYGRKYLSQLNPSWPITPIGQFPMNRSAPPAEGEFYIGGFPGVTVVQTWVEDLERLSDLDEGLLSSAPAADTFAFAVNSETGYGGLAHWQGGVLKRSLCAVRTRLIEDVGLPEPFENPYWAGEHGRQIGGIALPFEPVDLARAAEQEWIGVEISADGPDIQVAGFAVDGRPEPKLDKPAKRGARDIGELSSDAAAKLGNSDYDDYEDLDQDGGEFSELADASGAALKRVARGARRRFDGFRRALSKKWSQRDRRRS